MTKDVRPEASASGIQPAGNAARSMIATSARNQAEVRRLWGIIPVR
jgi:hypothetical protein